MRAVIAACVLVSACLLAGCRSQQEQALRDADREGVYGARRAVSYDILNPERDRDPGKPFQLSPF
jgi:hypothetical protein